MVQLIHLARVGIYESCFLCGCFVGCVSQLMKWKTVLCFSASGGLQKVCIASQQGTEEKGKETSRRGRGTGAQPG